VLNRKAPSVFDVRRSRQRVKELMRIGSQKASEGAAAGEAPVGAVIVDHVGEVIGAGRPRIIADNDPSAVAAMIAWRACGARDHWKDKTLLLTCGPDHIAYSMFHIFKFGQLIVGNTRPFAGRIGDVKTLGLPVHVFQAGTDVSLGRWIDRTPDERVREYLGADWKR